MLRMASAARGLVPMMTTGSLHQCHCRASWVNSIRPSGTRTRLRKRVIVNVTREYMGGSFNAKDTAASRRKLEAVT